MKAPASLRLAALWIVCCAYFNCVGWGLSILHELNFTGYLVSLVVGVVLLIPGIKALIPGKGLGISAAKFRWRMSRPLPAIYAGCAVLVLVGGIYYAPNNFDALVYRFPRILHWLAEGHWHWIDAPERRLNLAAVGFEWMMAPLLALTRSDRGFFLINYIPFLFMPNLVYSSFTQLGISKRVAWYWMWLVPCGYCFALQGGSIGNDSFAAMYLLAAICFGLRARKTGKIVDVAISILAAALLSGAKASDLPLLLPCVIVLAPSIQLILKKWWVIGAVMILAVFASFLPVAAVNAYYTGDWTGDPQNLSQMKLDSPLYGIIGNTLQILVSNSQPPVMPFASQMNEMLTRQLHAHCASLLTNFPQIGLKWGELPTEEAAGVGLGVTCLGFISLISTLGAFFRREPLERGGADRRIGIAACLGGCLALGVLMAKFGNEGVGRLIAPYYPIVIASVLLAPSNAGLVRKKWWQFGAVLTALMGVSCVILTPSRPIFPAQTLFNHLASAYPQANVINRAKMVYQVYSTRADSLSPIRKHLPAEPKLIGFIGADESEVSLWRPFGSRTVMDVSPQTHPANLPRILVTSDLSMQYQFGVSVEHWIATHHAKILGHEIFTTKLARNPQNWFVIEMPEAQ